MIETLTAGDLTVVVDPTRGARIASWRWRDLELLVTDSPERFGSGSFVMAPWAGRIRQGIATFGDHRLDFPVEDDGHALHGLVHDRRWTPVDQGTWRIELDEHEWFSPLRLTQHIAVTADAVTTTLRVEAPVAEAPVTVGWHPWFRRQLDAHAATLELTLPPAKMLRRDEVGIATSHRVTVPDGPWDDAFVEVDGPISVRWPDQVRVTVESDAPTTVVFTERDHAVCVEPQSGPPDEVNQVPRTVAPGAPLTLTARWTVRPDG